MGFSDQYPQIVAGLVKQRGSFGGTDSNGAPLPSMFPSDMAGLLVLVFEPLAHALSVAADRIAPVASVGADGVLDQSILDGFTPIGDSQTLADSAIVGSDWKIFLSGTAYSDGGTTIGHQRQPQNCQTYFEPAREPNLIQSNETNLISFAWQACDDYQACLDLAAQATYLYGSTPVAQDTCKAFLAAFQRVCSDLDVLNENPPPSFASDLVGALKAAANASSAAAGSLAANVGNAAGAAGSSFLDAFVQNADMVTLAIAGIVIYKVW